jgi:hypothetical protein
MDMRFVRMVAGFRARHGASWVLACALVIAVSVPTVALGATRTLSVGDVKVTEGNSSGVVAKFRVRLSSPAARKVTVKYTTLNGTATAPADYAARSGSVAFFRGQRTKYVSVPVVGDPWDEVNETFFLKIFSPTRATILDRKGRATIVDNDGPAISVSDRSANEGWLNHPETFTVNLSAPSPQSVTVNYATANLTAGAPSDYIATSGTLTFLPGQISKPVSVTYVGDVTSELTEGFNVNLSAPVNATIADGTGVGTILNDDCFDTNEGWALASNLGSVSGDLTSPFISSGGQICAGDSDWYKFTLIESDHNDLFSSEDLMARIQLLVGDTPTQTTGDLNMEIYRADLSWVGTSTLGGTTDELFDVRRTDGFFFDSTTTVYVRVFGFGNNKINSYTLRVDGDMGTSLFPNV